MAKLLTLHGQDINSTAYIYIYIYMCVCAVELKLFQDLGAFVLKLAKSCAKNWSKSFSLFPPHFHSVLGIV